MISRISKVVILLSLLCDTYLAMSQSWAVDKANEEWVKNESGVIRLNEQNVLLRNDGKVIFKSKTVNTILKGDANFLAELKVNYSKEIKILSIRGIIYDAAGNEISRNKKSDIKDYSDFNSFSIFEDNRIQVLEMKQFNFPYTVQFEYELELSNPYLIPNWFPQRYFRIPVEVARASYQYPNSSPIRFYSKNIDFKIDPKTDESGDLTMSWELMNLPKIEIEPLIASEMDAIPHLRAAPSTFTFGDINGDMSSWENMGKWFYQLNSGRDKLSDETIKKARTIVAKALSEEDKVKLLYEYLQNKTRYVSIQLGIGGLQPFEAQVVDNYSYGDCKALTNYMAALLTAVGIKSHYSLVYGGSKPEELYTEFPDDYFNHVILSVPMQNDTIWLECTSQTAPFGYLGGFTSDRHALLITENGGKLVRTPKYTIDQNTQVQNAHFTLNENDLVKGSIQLTRSGLQAEQNGLLQMMDASFDDKKKWIFENLGLPSFTITNFQFEGNKNKIPSVSVDCEIESKNMVSKTGSRLFITPNLMNASKFNLTSKKERKYSFKRSMEYQDLDSITFFIPSGYHLESKPEHVNLQSIFGSYEALFYYEGDKLNYKRTLIMNSGVYEPEKFGEYTDFMKKIEKADKAKFVFVKRT